LKAQARQIAEINPDIVDGISSDATHVIHDAQHDLPTPLFVTSRSYIATYPNVIIGSGTAKESLRCPLLLNDNLHEERWRAGRLAMPIIAVAVSCFCRSLNVPEGQNRHTLAFDLFFSFELI
jgi:hypothetical protein